MKKNILKITILFLLIIFLLYDIVFALGFNVSMTPSSDGSGNVIVKVKLDNLQTGDVGVNTFSAILNVDNDVYETISQDSISGLNNWSANYTDSSSKVTLTKASGTKNAEEMFQIVLKPKAGSSKKSGTVSLKSIVASDGTDEISIPDYSVNISATGSISASTNNAITVTKANNTNTVITITNTNNSTPSIVSNTVTNKPTNAISNNVSNYNTAQNTIVSQNTSNVPAPTNKVVQEEEVPYTGTRENIRIALIVLLVIAFAIPPPVQLSIVDIVNLFFINLFTKIFHLFA